VEKVLTSTCRACAAPTAVNAVAMALQTIKDFMTKPLPETWFGYRIGISTFHRQRCKIKATMQDQRTWSEAAINLP
jgi:hypothetical protein